MNTKIGTTFGLALLMAIAAVATMFALGMFSTTEVRADHAANHVLPGQVSGVTFTPASGSVNSQTSWDVTLGVSAALIQGSGTITISFPSGVVLPASIDKSRISVGPGTDIVPLTSDPTISGSTVTLTLPATDPGGSTASGIAINDTVTVAFSQLAGIVNPAKSGAAGSTTGSTAGKVKTSTQNTYANIGTAKSFATTLSVSVTSATEGGAVVVTLGGFTPGLTVSLDSGGAAAGSAVVGSDRKATITTTRKGTGTTVNATDTANIIAGPKTITLKASLTVTATGKVGDTITLTGKNYTADSSVANVAAILFGAGAILSGNKVTTLSYDLTDKDADGVDDDFSIKITIPSNAKAGVNQVKVTDAIGAYATATIEVTGRSVTISPDSGPPGTKFTVIGSGFPASRESTPLNKMEIGGLTPLTVTGLFTTGSGELPGSDQFTIPVATANSTITFTVSIMGADGVLATGSDKFTVTSRVLTIVPNSGPRGTKVLITGTKFTGSGTVLAGNITVDLKATVHTLANLTSSGDVPGISLAIPKLATIGKKTVRLTDTVGLLGTTSFTVTVPTLSVTISSATMGQSVPISGGGWVPTSSVTVTLKDGATILATKVTTTDAVGDFETAMVIPSTAGVGPKTLTFTAADASTYDNSSTAQTLSISKPTLTLSSGEASVGDVVEIVATGFPPSSGLSVLTIGGADVRSGVVTSDTEGGLTTSFIVPGVTGSNIVTVTIGSEGVSTSISVVAAAVAAVAATDTTVEIFADIIANDDNLVRVWRFSNADQDWAFYDPRPAFADANTLKKSGAGDIVWVNVNSGQDFQEGTLVSGWNLIVLK